MSDVLLVMTTLPEAEAAEALARRLIEAKLAACVNVLPAMMSVYPWKGAVECGREHLLLIKTRRETWPALRERIAREHPYELPEIIALPVADGLPAYLDWVREESRGP